MAPTTAPLPNYHLQTSMKQSCKIGSTLGHVKAQNEDPPSDSAPTDPNSTGKIKIAANNWLANRDSDDPPPPNSIIRAVTQYQNKKLLIETNTCEMAAWLKANAMRILQPLIGHPIKDLGRLYLVIAQFMPVQFQTNAEGTCELENSANLPVESISHVMWIKNPERRTPSQHVANAKIYCKSAEVTNTLILGSGCISHMGSQLCLHKDIRTPSTCVQCQRYGHIAPDCKETLPTCAKCREDHWTRECATNDTKCTPCGSSDHWTNVESCPKCIDHENATLDKNPKALTPYYITDERWTWGLHDNEPPNHAPDTAHTQQGHQPDLINTHQKHIYTHTKGPVIQQRTLTSSSFHHKPMQTGFNTTPLGCKAIHTMNPPVPPLHQQASTSQSIQLTRPMTSQNE